MFCTQLLTSTTNNIICSLPQNSLFLTDYGEDSNLYDNIYILINVRYKEQSIQYRASDSLCIQQRRWIGLLGFVLLLDCLSNALLQQSTATTRNEQGTVNNVIIINMKLQFYDPRTKIVSTSNSNQLLLLIVKLI